MHVGALIFILRLVVANADATESWGVRALESLNDDSRGPVARVVDLLVDMEKQLGQDADDDEEINEQMECWCKNSKKEREALVAENTERSGQLREEITSLRSKSEGLNTAIQDLTKQMNGEQEKLEEAIGMRKKDLAKFTATESSTMASIKALTGAAAALGAKSSTMQVNLDDESPVYKALKNSLNHGKHAILWAIHTKKERKVLEDIIAHERDIDLIQSKKRTVISAPSDVIAGTINSLTDTFKENLKQMQSDENRDSAAHEAMKKEKQKSIKAQEEMLEAKTQQLAAADERAANARIELDDAVEQLTGDTEFLTKLEEQCALHKKEYAVRTQTRKEELEAISKAKLVLTADDSKDTFTRSLGHSKRPEQKLGSRDLAEYKEERETQSMNSQINAARKKTFGTDARYGEGLLQTGHVEVPQKKVMQVVKENKKGLKLDTDPHLPAAQKLAAIADRTMQLYKAKYYMEEQQEKKAAEEAKQQAALKAKEEKERKNHPAQVKPEPRNKLGLTASEMKVRAAGMKQVGEGIIKMRQSLEMQQGEEQARQEWCKDEIIATEKQLDIMGRRKADQEEQLERIEMEIMKLKAQVRGLTRAQMDADIELAKAGIDSKKRNQAFQKTVMDQKLTQKLLKQALKVLEAFYAKKKAKASLIRQQISGTTDFDRNIGTMRAAASSVLGVDDQFSLSTAVAYENAREMTPAGGQMALVQSKGHNASSIVNKTQNASSAVNKTQEASTNKTLESKQNGTNLTNLLQDQDDDNYEPPAPPPTGFKKYRKSAASGGLLVMLEGLIADSQAMIEESVKDETGAMKGYEGYVAEANDLTKKRQEAITNRRLEIGKNEQFANEEKIRLNETIAEKARLRQYDIDLYGVEGCQYLLKNYETRYIERKEEIDNLKEAEAVLGAQETASAVEPKKEGEEKEEAPAEQVETEVHAVEGGVEMESNAHNGERAIVHMSSGN
eukprot:gnl/MRDRNA2_/MRDRNA2_93934_c0_seq1.p1 gnl/MRDRNA2_/MRDRNA2_93934_c0~~gnl/MRDRNA2_/MRDRNA2_93934_c0_seq1.p1  ORF type:complete len:959 (+),score=322.94 gnl/MRDRNA2_/MRDRNA2_93934_c0_seq1:83-2959(+)